MRTGHFILLDVQFRVNMCEKHTHWSKLSKWTWRQREQPSQALMTVLQDRVSGEQAHLGPLAPSNLFPSTLVPPLVLHWLSTTGFTFFPGCRLSQLYPHWAFSYICLNFTGRFKKTQTGIARPLPIPRTPPPLSAWAASWHIFHHMTLC